MLRGKTYCRPRLQGGKILSLALTPQPWFLMPTRVLIVDDSADFRGWTRKLLEFHCGVEVCGEAADGVEAIEKARQLKPDLIVLDVSMPRMNGLEAAPVLRDMVPDAVIILFTLYRDVVPRDVALRVGARVVVSKTDEVERLLEEVRKIVDVGKAAKAAHG
jgi:two-component system, chemotaxis family, chemotaxis protein CheY